jgi:thymidylate kinase
MKNIFVCIDGVDLTGKTTNAELLAKKIGGVYFKTPSQQFEEMRKIFNAGDETAKYLFYLATICQASKDIAKLLITSNVVVDRYLYSTICYHAFSGVNVGIVKLDEIPIIKPDFSVCLIVRNKEWTERAKLRGEDYSYARWQKSKNISKLLASFIQKDKGIIIDTSNIQPEQVVQVVIDKLKEKSLL